KKFAAASSLLPLMSPFSDVRSSPGLFTHSPLAVRRPKPVSTRPPARLRVLPLIVKSPSIRPYFCPHNQHSAQRNWRSGQLLKSTRETLLNGDALVGRSLAAAVAGL